MITSQILADHNELMNYAPSVLLPNTTQLLRNANKQLGLLEKSLIDLDVIVNATLAESDIYTSLADKVQREFETLLLDTPNIMDKIQLVLSIANPIIMIIAVGLVIKLHIKQRNILIAFKLLGAKPRSQSADVTTRRVFIPDALESKLDVLASATPERPKI